MLSGSMCLAEDPYSIDHATVTVTADRISDTLHWQVGAGRFETGILHGKRAVGFDIVEDANAVPPPTSAAAPKK
jgi:hypothetical protein